MNSTPIFCTVALSLALGACGTDVSGTPASLGTGTHLPWAMLGDGGADATTSSTRPADDGPPITRVGPPTGGSRLAHRYIDPPRGADDILIDRQPSHIPHDPLGSLDPPQVVPGSGTDFGGGGAAGGGSTDGSGGTPMPGDGSGGDGSGGDDGSGGAPLTGGGGGGGGGDSGGGGGGGAGTGGGGGCATCGL